MKEKRGKNKESKSKRSKLLGRRIVSKIKKAIEMKRVLEKQGEEMKRGREKEMEGNVKNKIILNNSLSS